MAVPSAVAAKTEIKHCRRTLVCLHDLMTGYDANRHADAGDEHRFELLMSVVVVGVVIAAILVVSVPFGEAARHHPRRRVQAHSRG